MPDDSRRPRPAGSLQHKDLGDEMLFYDQGADKVHVLNATAREVYLLCDGKRTVDDVVRELVRKYEVDEAVARRDSVAALEELLELGVLELA